MSHDAEQGVQEEGAEDNPMEYCEMFFSSVLYAEGINEYEGRTCEATSTYYLKK